MYKPKLTPISHERKILHADSALPNPFRLLTWNLYKTDFSHYIHRPIEQLLNIETPHLLSLQEAATVPMQGRFFNLPYVMAPNIETRRKHFGVLTASEYGMTAQHQCLTRSRELGWMTHKTALITEHLLEDGQTLTHINIHAINFVPNRLFRQELNLLWSLVADKKGPMIVSGDFNTWNKARVSFLENSARQLGLSQVSYPDTTPIRTLNRQILDYVFYRGLTVDSARAFHVKTISDHNPLEVVFSV
ncbi:endonuclease/exonuclease/phosphatase family protein [Thiomicrorhabdus heinhorstiae]|uniref:Endonuclease/exonuclease/phosphatase family protein n=1 Tax=Thiomicrorhabdus heinhorstiae TaxID=2748010 RepID=A0ABS0BWB0_9GAMM|nr:endonuclease/exonuclease/phosphatase family protein [Thiomicrorhabdus heinhorstiae]MBF6057096.1 endonuclease/exonuclease/phosphatase family protein [Thiomicrorhabdus heinhorstiae]